MDGPTALFPTRGGPWAPGQTCHVAQEIREWEGLGAVGWTGCSNSKEACRANRYEMFNLTIHSLYFVCAVQMKFNQSARNQPAPPTASQVPSGSSSAGVTSTTPAAAGSGPAPTSDNFVQLLAQAEPQQQKQIIGEQLYRQIYSLHPELTGKITGTEGIRPVLGY